MSELAVLLRDHDNTNATIRLALKVDQFSISVGKQPMQIPLPGASPIIMDLGSNRPTITISGVVDNIGMDPSNGVVNPWFNMEKMTIQGQTYYIPYKNYLEQKLITWNTSTASNLQIEIGDATTPDYSGSGSIASSGGGIYKVAIHQFQFAVMPAMEDRWTFSTQFVSHWREGLS